MKLTETIPLLQIKSIRRILVMKWSAMGDIVISSTLFEDIRRAFPHAEIDLNTLPPWESLFRHDPRFTNILVIDLKGQERGFRGVLHWLRTVRSRRYDLIIDLQSNDRTRLLLTLLRLRGGRETLAGNHRQWPYHHGPPPHHGPLNALNHQQQTLQMLGIPTPTPRPVLHPDQKNYSRVAEIQDRHDLKAGNYAIFLPGCHAAGHLKRWGAQRYASLAGLLRKAGLEKIVLLGGSDDAEECERIHKACSHSWLINLCGQTEVLDIIPLASDSRLIVANDTGTAHVVSCTDRPMCIICGPTDPRLVKPAGGNVNALQAELPCINCYRKTCEHHSCMKAITPERVLEALRPALPS